MHRNYGRVLILVVGLLWGLCASAQNARLSGQVLDPQGAVVPSAELEIINTDSKAKLTATSDENGHYALPYLPAGTYDLHVRAKGFAVFQTQLTLGMGQALEMDIPLSVMSSESNISVEGNVVTQIETQSSEVTGTITGKEVPAIGLNGRNFTQLATLVTGVSNQTGQDEARVGMAGSVSFSINGGRTEYNSFQVDGSETINAGIHKDKTSLIVTPSIDAIQEIKVLTSNYGAMYPSTGSGTTIVTTKSGGDTYHGSGYEFLRNELLNAKGYFDVGNRAPLYRRNDFGGTIGGPLRIPHFYDKKGKTYFFFSEEFRIEMDPYAYRQAVPSMAERNGDFSDVCPAILPGSSTVFFRRTEYPDCPSQGIRIDHPGQELTFGNNRIPLDRNAQLIMGTGVIPIPTSTTTGCNSTIGSCYNAETSLPTYWREELFRIDHNISDKTRLGLRYIHDEWDTTTPVPQFAFTQNTFPTIRNRFYGPGTSAVVRLTQTLNSTLLNEIVLSYTDQKITLANVPAPEVTFQGIDELGAAGVGMTTIFNNGLGGKMPGIVIAGNNQAYGGRGFAVDPGYMPWQHTNPTYSVTDNITKSYGKHNIQFGALWVAYQRNQTNGSIGAATGDTQGILTFSNVTGANTTGNAVADFLSGHSIASYRQDSAQARYYQRYQIVEPYIQDDFKISSRFTLNLGLRLSLFGTYHEANKNVYNWVPGAYDPQLSSSLLVGPQGQLIDRNTGLALHIDPNDPSASLDPRITNGLLRCGLSSRVPDSCMKGHLINPAPRIGFAWSPFGDKTVIRGGYGLFFEHGTANEANTGSLEGGAPTILSMTHLNPSGWSSVGLGADGRPLAFPLNVTSIPTKVVWPYVQQWSLSIQRELPQGMLISAAYVGSKGTFLPIELQLNQLQPVSAADNPYGPNQALLISGFNATILDPNFQKSGDCGGTLTNGVFVGTLSSSGQVSNYTPAMANLLAACYGAGQSLINPNALREYAPGIGQIYSIQNVANSTYNSLQVGLRRTRAPVVLGVSYTYSHSIDNASDRSDATMVNSYDLRSSRASSSFDQRHLLNLSYVYNLPFLTWRDKFLGIWNCSQEDIDGGAPQCSSVTSPGVNPPSKWMESFLRGWQLSGVSTFQTGTPFTVINIGSPNGISTQDNAGVANGSGAGSYPDVCGDPYSQIPVGGNNSSSFGPLLLDPGAFCAPRGLTFGTAGRNFLRNPNRWNFDAALLKKHTLANESYIEFRIEMFNVFNHTQFRIYDPTLGNQANNTVSCYGGLGTAYSAAGGDGTNCLTGSSFLHPVSAHRPRTTQLGVKWVF